MWWVSKVARASQAHGVRLEDQLTGLALLAIVFLPLIEVVARALVGAGIPGSIDYVRHLTLWVAFLGATIAARQDRHLALGFADFLRGSWRNAASITAGSVGTAVSLVLAVASAEMVWGERLAITTLGGVVPQWAAQVIMPFGFALIGLRFLWRTPGGMLGRAIAVITTLAAISLFLLPEESRALLLLPGLCLIIVATIAGAPIFVILGATASLLFFIDTVPLAAIPVESYRIASNPILPTIPLFTLAGTILAEGKASERLARLFRALFGWIPGGTAVATVGVCAFFTTFTGGSGVTILALGGLLLPVLLRQGYGERFSLGALTVSGSLGILLPLSLLVILYGVSAHAPIDRLFLAGLVPGVMLVAMVAVYAVYNGWTLSASRSRFHTREALSAIVEAKWEVLLPIAVLYGIFSGHATLVEVAGLVALYTLVLEFVVNRDLKLGQDLARILVEAAVMIGGIMIILATAMGLTNYLIYADVPTLAAEWVQAGIESPWVFLLALNGFLLIAGCLLDIFSALVVIVPLILPVARAFGIDPLHLGIIFLANMQLGYLTPPVGMNLFLASFRFKRPLLEICSASVPFFLIMAAGVLIITFFPILSVGVVRVLGL
ncbi:MAG: TRAP transporter large permease subunit [Gammaproteobacteria bacterium]|nr:TRAP transporter large permease subunit [Gammaproteobacteria bacterium]